MPASTRPRKPFKGYKYQRDLDANRDPGRGAPEPLRLPPDHPFASVGNPPESPRPKAYVHDRKVIGAEPGSVTPGKFVSHSTRLARRRGILVASGTAGAATATAVHQHNKRRQPVEKIYDPFAGEYVEVAKTTTGQKLVWDSRFTGKKGKQARKDYRRDYASKIPSHVGAGAAGGAAAAGALSAATGSKGSRVARGKGGAIVGGAVGAYGGLLTAANRARSAQQRKFDEAGIHKAKSGAPEFGTEVRFISPRTPSGSHVSHENKLYQHGKRKKQPKGDTRLRRYSGKGTSAMPEIKKSVVGTYKEALKKPLYAGAVGAAAGDSYGRYSEKKKTRSGVAKDMSTLQGASRSGSRGTPLSTMAHVGRHGRRIVGLEDQVVH